ncbi:hypothetical protein [Haloplanus halophilus]|uniref:hypothetical protein n=1 Tax=Haloplanus halophilus TaxID=2949993 RepID=UPI00203AC8AF|nr:hypothetical protein [Haloplanus sp. GDY1]
MSGDREPSAPAEAGEADAGDDDPSSAASSWGRRDVALAGLVAVVVVVAGALLVGSAGETSTPDATGDGAAAVTATPTPAATGTAETTPDVAMRVRSIAACGSRCRTVTIALTNRGDDAARSVRVSTVITTDGSFVWEGASDVGRLDAGETVTRTRTVRVGYVDAARIESNGGRIRIETTVRTADGTRTFTERRTVS